MSSARDLERRSAAVTLSDMEMFIFPELIYSLVLANMMSPRIWKWREDPWFDGLERMKPYRRITRLKQFIMDHYAFNLDLDTWGLTTQKRELARFSDFVDPDALARSNALFGYEGDKYYFDIDIRTHFGLDKYEGSVIPYWKTETVEAMDAFQHKAGYVAGAGECVSLSTLYAAALFIVARIPLSDIFLMATPLHSQNFVILDDGILTNNRRLVTKNMWFNGTALSEQARRALENERVTIVAHETGVVHNLYDRATIARGEYDRFATQLKAFLSTDLTEEILGNFLRHDGRIQKCFQMRWLVHGKDHFVPMERVFAYEHGSPYRVTDKTRGKLMANMDMEEFRTQALPSRIVFNDLEAFVHEHEIDLNDAASIAALKAKFTSDCLNAEIALESLLQFCRVAPRLPAPETKEFEAEQEALCLSCDMSRGELIERLDNIRDRNEMADMAFYAYRDLNRTGPEPFLLAAVQRNPVCLEKTGELGDEDLVKTVTSLPDESIYDEPGRLAQPDEVWNYGRGDGAEKAVLVATVLRSRRPGEEMSLEVGPERVVLNAGAEQYPFPSGKSLSEGRWNIPARAQETN